jgi:NAD(P)-dependent dehydrogenase (short-subunit alcohol dehydrogenase family)
MPSAAQRDGKRPTMSDRLGQPRTAAVTGAGSGLGREIALQLAAKGYRVFGTGLLDKELDDLCAASNGRVSLSAVTKVSALAIVAQVYGLFITKRNLDVISADCMRRVR